MNNACDKSLNHSLNLVDIIVPSYNRPEKLDNCLRSLQQQSFKNFRLLCVLRPSDLASNQIAKSFQSKFKIDILPIIKDGVIAAENTAIAHATAPFVLFLDDDAVAPKNWIESVLAHFQSPPYPVAVGGRDFVLGSPEQSNQTATRVGQMTFYGKIYGNHHKQSTGIRNVATLKGVNMAVRKSFLHFLDPLLHSSIKLGNGSQWELDLCLKLQRYGPIVFDPEICVQHDSNHSHFISEKVQVNDSHNMTYVFLKHFSHLRRITFLLYASLVGNAQIVGVVKAMSLCKEGFLGLKKYFLSQKGLLSGIDSYLRVPKSEDSIVTAPLIYLCPNGYVGGAERFVLTVCESHQKDHNAIIIFFDNGPALALAGKLGIPFILLKNRPKLSSPLKLYKTVKELRSIYRQLTPRLIHCTMAYSMIIQGLTCYRICPIVWFQHGPVGGVLDFLASLFHTDQILFNSINLKQVHEQLTPLFKQRNPPKVIPLGVRQLCSFKKEKRPEQTIVYATAGRISSIKGQDTIIKAYQRLISKNKKYQSKTQLWIIGSPNSKEDAQFYERLSLLAKKSDSPSSIKFIEYQEELSELYKKIE